MDYIFFCRITFFLVSFTSYFIENEKIINSKEIIIEDLRKKLLIIEKYQKSKRIKFIKFFNQSFQN
jgi:hypothetical protein